MPTYLWRFAIYLLSVEGYTSDILLKKTATVGKDLHITCSFAQSEVGVVSIERDNTDEVTMNVTNSCGLLYCNANYDYLCNESKIILTIPGIFVQDSLHGSRWKCHIKSADIYSEALLLYVNVPITKIDLTATQYDKSPAGILAGSIQHFTCTTNPGRPPSKIQWYLSGANITGAAIAQSDACYPGCNEKVISSSVLLYTGNINDNGKTIHCTAINVDQQSVRSLDRRIDILYPPVIVNIPDYTIKEGNSLHITPSIDANPPPISVWWTRQNDTSFMYTSMNLTINNIQWEYSDYYMCHAMNIITTSSHSTQNRTTETIFKVNVLYAPSVYIKPMYSPLIVQEDQQNIKLSCVVARANPNDDILFQWTYPAGTVSYENLTIISVLKSDYGLYSCNASNLVGTSKSTTKEINVHYEPVLDGIPDYNIEAGRTLTVTPSIDANPVPTSIWWTRQNNFRFIYHGLNLKITNIHTRDSDNYTCHVMNTLTPSGLSAQNRTSITVFNINVQNIPNKEPVNGAAVGVGTGFAVILVTLGVTSLIIILYRKRRFTERKENSNRRIYESGLDEPRRTAETDKHIYSELQDIKPDSKQKQERSEKGSNTIVEFGEVRSITNGKIYEKMKITTNEKQIHQKDTNLYVNMDF